MPAINIIFITPYPPGEAPSQRFRFEQYPDSLKNNGFIYTLAPFLNKRGWGTLYLNGQYLKKAGHLMFGFIKRFFLLFTLTKYSHVFIHREAAPLAPPVFEWFIAKILRKKIIYDFDDAIWLEDPQEKGTLLSRLKWKGKVKNIIRWSYKVSCGNEYLAQYARPFNKNVIVNPTTIDSESLHNPTLYKTVNSGKVTIGWTGTHSTLPYLQPLIPVLDVLETEL
ncbi:MAG: glycosyltransferase family 1 protein, partial [Cyclobacteriaceae bacterium]|nr:glycosyltransferase family 1 protein [Cyclobacteriaceae bacterium]